MSADGINLYKLEAVKLPALYNFESDSVCTGYNDILPSSPFPSVPSGKVLIITGFSIEYRLGGVPPGGVAIQNNNTGLYYYQSLVQTVAATYKDAAWQLGTPWIVREGEAIDIVQQGGAGVSDIAVNFVGFYADKSIIE